MTEGLSDKPPSVRIEAYFVEYGRYKFLLRGDGIKECLSEGVQSVGPVVFGRCAVRMLGRGTIFFPAYAADDYGRIHRGFEAVKWILASGFRYPRADVVGWQEEGEVSSVMLRDIDVGLGAGVFVSDGEGGFPGFPVMAGVYIGKDKALERMEYKCVEGHIPLLGVSDGCANELGMGKIIRKLERASL